jgi:hypothetical protein
MVESAFHVLFIMRIKDSVDGAVLRALRDAR